MKMKWIQDHWSLDECAQAERWMEEAVRWTGLISSIVTEILLDVGLLPSKTCHQYANTDDTCFTTSIYQCSCSRTSTGPGAFIQFEYSSSFRIITFNHRHVKSVHFSVHNTLDFDNTSTRPSTTNTYLTQHCTPSFTNSTNFRSRKGRPRSRRACSWHANRQEWAPPIQRWRGATRGWSIRPCWLLGCK